MAFWFGCAGEKRREVESQSREAEVENRGSQTGVSFEHCVVRTKERKGFGRGAVQQAGATACRLNTLRTDREKGIGQTDTYIHTYTHTGEEKEKEGRRVEWHLALGGIHDPSNLFL